MPRRRTDHSFIIDRKSTTNEHFLNARLDVGASHIFKRNDGKYERHFTLECPYCCLPVGYASGEVPKRANVIYIYPRSLSPKQGEYPEKWEQDLRLLIKKKKEIQSHENAVGGDDDVKL
jgi:hypothetical protein